jgi:hypothetical protein
LVGVEKIDADCEMSLSSDQERPLKRGRKPVNILIFQKNSLQKIAELKE